MVYVVNGVVFSYGVLALRGWHVTVGMRLDWEAEIVAHLASPLLSPPTRRRHRRLGCRRLSLEASSALASGALGSLAEGFQAAQGTGVCLPRGKTPPYLVYIFTCIRLCVTMFSCRYCFTVL